MSTVGAYRRLQGRLTALRKDIGVRVRVSVIRAVSFFLRLFSEGLSALKMRNRVLFWVPGGFLGLLNIEAAIGLALELRGHKVHFVICDGSYTACAQRFYHTDTPIERWGELCGPCKSSNTKLLRILGLRYSYIGDHVLPEEARDLKVRSSVVTKDTITDLALDGIPLGSSLLSALIRQTRGSGLENQEELIRQFAFTVLMVSRSSRRVLDWYKPDTVFMSHGVYADWGPALKNSVRHGIPVVSYITSYLENHFYFGKVDSELSMFQSMSDKAWKDASSRTLTSKQEERLFGFIRSRYTEKRSEDMKNLLKTYSGDPSRLRNRLGLVQDLPVWGILTHVTWDSAVDYYPMVFDSLDQWLSVTLQTIAGITNVQWVIKIHPSEKNDNPLTGAQALVEKEIPALPPHMRLIAMDDNVSPLDFYDLVDGAITVFGTAGLELSLVGKPVILAGTPHYGRKGFTHDALDRQHYLGLLERASELGRLDEETARLARNYAFCYFMQKQIPLPFIRNQFEFCLEKMHTLIPNRNSVVDFLCRRILDGRDFILDESITNRDS